MVLYNNTVTAVRARLWLTSVRPKERTEKRQAHRVEHGSLRDKSTEDLPQHVQLLLNLAGYNYQVGDGHTGRC